MAITFDIILAAIFLFFVIRYWICGLVGSLLRAGRLIFSLIVAALFCRPCANLLTSVFSNFPSESRMLSGILGFVGAFVIAFVIATIVIRLVGSVKLPIVSGINKLLGFVLGLIIGILVVSAISTVVYTALEVITFVNPESAAMDVYNDSYVFSFVYDLRVFEFVRNII